VKKPIIINEAVNEKKSIKASLMLKLSIPEKFRINSDTTIEVAKIIKYFRKSL